MWDNILKSKLKHFCTRKFALHERLLYFRHPLFPLMALMFERCEQASATPDTSGMDNFDSDIQAFIRHQEKENKSLLVDDDQLNNLVCTYYPRI